MVIDMFKKDDRKNIDWYDKITTLNHKYHVSEPSNRVSRELSGFDIAIMLFLQEFGAMSTSSSSSNIPSDKVGKGEAYVQNFKLYVLNIIIDILTTFNLSISQKYI